MFLFQGRDEGAKVGAQLDYLQDAEALLAQVGQQHSAVVECLDLGDAGDGAHVVRHGWLSYLHARLDQADAEERVGVYAVLDHELVPILEYVEGERRSREEHHVEGE